MSTWKRIKLALGVCCLTVLWVGGTTTRAQAADRLLVFAASSLSDVMAEIGKAFAATGKTAPVFSFAASSTLARQIENSAPAALFASADEQWMDYLAERKLISPDSRAVLAGNSLALIVPAGQSQSIEIGPGFALARLLNGGKLAIGDPNAVPAGRYAKAALETFGVWRDVEGAVVRADNVRAALAFVARGAAAAGIVYATDTVRAKNIATLGVFPDGSHPPITYPIALVAGHDDADARTFLRFAMGDEARAIFTKYGFRSP